MTMTETTTDTGTRIDDVAELVRRSGTGDQRSWDALVARFGAMVWSIARSMGRSPAEAADVSQTVWLSLVEHLDTINQPERVGAWLATTTRRECLRVQERSKRVTPSDDERRFDERQGPRDELDTDLLKIERDAALWRAF